MKLMTTRRLWEGVDWVKVVASQLEGRWGYIGMWYGRWAEDWIRRRGHFILCFEDTGCEIGQMGKAAVFWMPIACSWLYHVGGRTDWHLLRSRAWRVSGHLLSFYRGTVVEKSCLKHYWRLLRIHILPGSGSWNEVSFNTRQVFLVWHFTLVSFRT